MRDLLLRAAAGFSSEPYAVQNSLLLDGVDDVLLRTFTSAGDRKKWTLSFWIERNNNFAFNYQHWLLQCGFGTDNTNNFGLFFQNLSASLSTNLYNTDCGSTGGDFGFYDRWYNIVLVADTAQATAADRLKLYVNSVQETGVSGTNLVLNQDTAINAAQNHALGGHTAVTRPASGHICEIHFIDGQALTPDDFGQVINLGWRPKKYTGTYGTNGFFLEFKDASSTTTLGYDTSGNGNHWTLSGSMTTAAQTTYVPASE